MFKMASEASLNRAKSVIIPMTHLVPQEWCVQIGCKILQAQETTKYLGFFIGFKVKQEREAGFLIGEVRKKLSFWVNCCLFFSGRSVLLQHVIWAMSVYHFMSMSLNLKCYKRLEAVSKMFLWGRSTEGMDKKALVAWRKTALRVAKGGLGFKPFQQQILALKMRWCGQIMKDAKALWVKLANESIERSLDLGPGCRTRRKWTVVEGLLLDNSMVTGSPLLCDLARGLSRGCNILCFELEGANLLVHLTVEQMLLLFCGEEVLLPQQIISLKGFL